ncbi:MAG: peroxiredoxin [Burkholderiaceae bacterium]|nr:peroxiredoxin [Burkholderiaceae bacterium]
MSDTPSAIGLTVPEFSAPMTGNGTFTLSSFKGKNVVLFFYPKDNTPGCSAESMTFRDLYAEFQAANTEIFGVSRDSIKSHEGFKSKLAMPFELISDANEDLCTMFNVLREKTMYGKKVRGIERSTFVIDANGTLLNEWRDVKVPGHVEQVLKYVTALKQN